MENLTKQQLVLLALLVSFVTSIATGIVTVSLVNQAPPGVTQTINRVVEKTIERVASTDNRASVIASSPQIKIIKEEDLVITAADEVSKSMVKIKGSVSPDAPLLLGIGIILNNEGMIAADKNVIEEGGSYQALWTDGTTAELSLVARNDESKIAYFKIIPKKDLRYEPVSLGNSDKEKIGETVITLGGVERTELAKGTLQSLDSKSGIITDVGSKEGAAPLINLSGDVIGLKLRRMETGQYYYNAINTIKEQLSTIKVQTAASAAANASSTSSGSTRSVPVATSSAGTI